MANKALGRDLGDLLSRARPARMVAHVGPRPATAESDAGATTTATATATATATVVAATVDGSLAASAAPEAVAPPIAQQFPLVPAPTPIVSRVESPIAPPEPPAPAQSPAPRAKPAGRRPFAPTGASSYSAPGPATRANPPPPAGSMTAFLVLLGIDSILLITGAALAFTDWVPAPLSSYLALVAVLAGAGCTALAYLLRPAPAPKPEPSKVRVQLRRI